MEEKLNERMAVVENRLDQHDERLNRHGDKIDGLQAENIKQNSMLEKLCIEQEKTHRKTQENGDKLDEIHAEAIASRKLNKMLAWIVITGLPALLSALYTMRQLGWL